MTEDEIVEALDSLTGADPEADHEMADYLLKMSAPEKIREAWDRAAKRFPFWYA